MEGRRSVVPGCVTGQGIGRPFSFPVFLILVTSLTVLLSVPGVSSGGTLYLGLKGIHAGAHLGPDAAVDSVLHVLPPLGPNSGDIRDFDLSLTGFLTVTICEIGAGGSCTPIREFTSQEHLGGGLDYINLQNHHYHVNWNVAKGDVGKALEIHFAVAGMDVGHVAYTPATGRTVPIKFRIDNHPRIRTRVLCEQGLSALEIATALRDEFDLTKDEVTQLLLVENFSNVEIGTAVILVFDMGQSEAVEWMHEHGFNVTDMATVLKIVFDLNKFQMAQFIKGEGYSARVTYDVLMDLFSFSREVDIERILFAAGYKMGAFIDFTALETVRKFTPVLYFDGSHKGLPMSAQVYFETVMTNIAADPTEGKISWGTFGGTQCGPDCFWLCGRDTDCGGCCAWGMHNNNFQMLRDGQVPTYYKVISDIETVNDGRLRIAYWWFYGFQAPCWDLCVPTPVGYVYCGDHGAHHGDWECIQVTTDTSRTRADYVTYTFHGEWYTRHWGYFDTYEGRPVAYVGKLGHGAYHNDANSGFLPYTPFHCCQYADYRESITESTTWRNADDNLVSLRGNSEPWMLADQVDSQYVYDGLQYTVAFWRWGPTIKYCDDWLFFVCLDYNYSTGCSTHPTVHKDEPYTDEWPDWDMSSCKDEGCGTYTCKGIPYLEPAFFNQLWPWDTAPATVSSGADGTDGSGSSESAGAEPVQVREVSLALSTANPCVEARLAGTFSMPRAMDARLNIYDVRGRLISSIVNSRAEPGVHSFEWNLRKASGSRVAPGIYFLRLDTPDRAVTQKVVIQR